MPLVPSHTEPTAHTLPTAAMPVSCGVPAPPGAGAGVNVRLEPRQLANLALARRIKRLVQRTFRSDQTAQEFDRAARAVYQVATRRPVPALVAEALTNDETSERGVISLATVDPTSAASRPCPE